MSGSGEQGPTTVTDTSGAFTLADSGAAVLVFWKPGYRWVAAQVPATGDQLPVTVNAKLQPEFILAPSSPVSSVISPDDHTYDSASWGSFEEGAYYCSPCKEIKIFPFLRGAKIRFRVHWTGSVPLDLWVGSRYTLGVTATGVGSSSDQDLIVVDTSDSGLDTALIGAGKRNGLPQTLNQPVAFQLSVEPAQ